MVKMKRNKSTSTREADPDETKPVSLANLRQNFRSKLFSSDFCWPGWTQWQQRRSCQLAWRCCRSRGSHRPPPSPRNLLTVWSRSALPSSRTCPPSPWAGTSSRTARRSPSTSPVRRFFAARFEKISHHLGYSGVVVVKVRWHVGEDLHVVLHRSFNVLLSACSTGKQIELLRVCITSISILYDMTGTPWMGGKDCVIRVASILPCVLAVEHLWLKNKDCWWPCLISQKHLHVHVVGGDELGAAEEHGDPEEQHNLQLPAAIVAHNLGNQG